MHRTFSPIYRIMHWLIALCMIFMLITIFLRLNWMNKFHVANILNTELTKLDVNLEEDQLISIAKTIRKPMWDWHIYIGYVLLGLYTLRMLLPLFDEMKFRSPFKVKTFKEKFELWSYAAFYIGMAITLMTGFFIVNGPKSIKKDLEEIHELSLYFILGFIVIHFTGILIAEYGKEKGIVSKMVSGKN